MQETKINTPKELQNKLLSKSSNFLNSQNYILGKSEKKKVILKMKFQIITFEILKKLRYIDALLNLIFLIIIFFILWYFNFFIDILNLNNGDKYLFYFIYLIILIFIYAIYKRIKDILFNWKKITINLNISDYFYTTWYENFLLSFIIPIILFVLLWKLVISLFLWMFCFIILWNDKSKILKQKWINILNLIFFPFVLIYFIYLYFNINKTNYLCIKKLPWKINYDKLIFYSSEKISNKYYQIIKK